MSEICGEVEPGYEPCADAFAANLRSGEVGAACAIRVGGRTVVDIWGGDADPASRRAWQRDTIVPPFSVSKGVAAICVLELVNRGFLELDNPVSRYWPEFAKHDKGSLTVRQALAHQAGIPYVDGPVDLADLADPARMAERLAAQRPIFAPATAHIYHPITIGWITSELVRRVTGLPIGAWLHEEIAGPLGLSLFFGLPASERYRTARVVYREADAADAALAVAAPVGSMPWQALTLNGAISFSSALGERSLNDYRLQAVELVGANLLADARSLATFYSACLVPVDGLRLLSDQLIREACAPISTGPQFGMNIDGPSWGAGIMIPWSIQPMLGGMSFGHDGMGGSLAFANLERQLSFAYVRNAHVPGGVKDPEVYAVVDALATVLG